MSIMRKGIINICIAGILVFGIYGCAQTTEDSLVVEPEIVETENTEPESEKEIDVVDEEAKPEESIIPEAVSENDARLHWMPYCEFEEIEANHEILEYDISTSPRYDYENTLLRDYIEKEKEENDEFVNRYGSIYEMWIDYHLFDFNDDGIEDYLLCFDGLLWSGSAGHQVEIFIVKEDGMIERVLRINLRFHHYESPDHERFTVLNEKSDGFYAIVLPGSNRILRYDKDERKYVFHERE